MKLGLWAVCVMQGPGDSNRGYCFRIVALQPCRSEHCEVSPSLGSLLKLLALGPTPGPMNRNLHFNRIPR